LSVNELLEGGRDRVRQRVLADDGYGVRFNLRPKACLGVSYDENAIASRYVGVCAGFDVDGFIAILDEQIHVAFSVVGDGGLEGDGKGEACLFIREGMNGRQRIQRLSLRSTEGCPEKYDADDASAGNTWL